MVYKESKQREIGMLIWASCAAFLWCSIEKILVGLEVIVNRENFLVVPSIGDFQGLVRYVVF